MAEQFLSAIAQEFPDYLEFSNLLDLAETTWQRYGLDAEALAGLDEWHKHMLLIKLGF